MTTILGISGSLRAGSYNTKLLNASARMLGGEAGATLDVATLHGIPLYDGDLETSEGSPPAVRELKARILASNGLLLATPEYNNGIPGVFKNAVDWLSRPASDIPMVFGNRPVAVIGATPGGSGTVLAQIAWLPVLRTLGTRPWFGGRLQVSRAQHVFNEAGEMVDEATRNQLREFLRGFIGFVQAGAGAEASGA